MIWSLIKVLLFVASIAGLTYGAGVLMDTGGGIRIAMLGVEFTLGPLQTAITLLLLLAALWVLLKLIGL
jgi:HemY protein